MSRDPVQTALRAAARHGAPLVHRDGSFVVLVLAGTQNHRTGEVRGQVLTRMCASSGIARAVEARALGDLELFPEARDPLAVAALYAEAAYRHACRRARRAS